MFALVFGIYGQDEGVDPLEVIDTVGTTIHAVSPLLPHLFKLGKKFGRKHRNHKSYDWPSEEDVMDEVILRALLSPKYPQALQPFYATSNINKNRRPRIQPNDRPYGMPVNRGYSVNSLRPLLKYPWQTKPRPIYETLLD